MSWIINRANEAVDDIGVSEATSRRAIVPTQPDCRQLPEIRAANR